MNIQGYLGIDAGTQGLSVIFCDESLKILAHGEGSYQMVPGLAADCYEQQPGDWEQALATAMTGLRKKLDAAGITMEVQAIGISGQMHGEVLADDARRFREQLLAHGVPAALSEIPGMEHVAVVRSPLLPGSAETFGAIASMVDELTRP